MTDIIPKEVVPMMLDSEIIKIWHEEWYEKLLNPQAKCIWGNRWQAS